MKHHRQGVRSHGVGLLLAWCCCYYHQGLPEYHCTTSVHALAGSSNRKSKSKNTSKGKGKRKDGSSGGGFGSSSSTTMANPIHTPAGPEIERLVHFLTAHNAKGLTNVEIGYHAQTGMRGLFGTQKFKKKQIICQIPSDCALVLNDPTTLPTDTTAAADNGQTTTTPAQRGWNFLQMYVKDTNAQQFWSPYLETLPKQLQQFNDDDDDDDDDDQETDKDDANAPTPPQQLPTIDPTPDFFIEEDLELFEYPRVIRLANERKAQLESVLTVAAAAASSSSGSDTTRSIAMEELQYATWLTSSRSFKLTLPDDADDDADNADDEDENTTASKNEENGVMLRTDSSMERKAVYVMVPFLDMANHNSDQANCKLTLIDPEKDEAWFALEATRPIAPGKELTLCYGETGTESSVELLLNYGFVPTTNKIDPLMLTKAKQKEEDENATDTIPTLAGWMTTLDEDRTMLQMAIDTKDPVLQKILNFRIRLKESY